MPFPYFLGGIMIKCGRCGTWVDNAAYTCHYCGRDVRVMRDNDCHCYNCGIEWNCDKDAGPSGYPCLAWEDDFDSDGR